MSEVIEKIKGWLGEKYALALFFILAIIFAIVLGYIVVAYANIVIVALCIAILLFLGYALKIDPFYLTVIVAMFLIIAFLYTAYIKPLTIGLP